MSADQRPVTGQADPVKADCCTCAALTGIRDAVAYECPVHGPRCTCRDFEDDADPACPLHGDPAVNGTADYARPGDPICVWPGCESAVREYGDMWWHVQPAKVGEPVQHRPQPGTERVPDAPMSDTPDLGGLGVSGGPGGGASPIPGPPPGRYCTCAVREYGGDLVDDRDPDCRIHGDQAESAGDGSADDLAATGTPVAYATGDVTDLHRFHLTFFLLDATRPNPRFELADPDGYVTIYAASGAEAHSLARSLLGRQYHDIYGPDNEFQAELYPRGELLRIVVPPGLIEQEDHR